MLAAESPERKVSAERSLPARVSNVARPSVQAIDETDVCLFVDMIWVLGLCCGFDDKILPVRTISTTVASSSHAAFDSVVARIVIGTPDSPFSFSPLQALHRSVAGLLVHRLHSLRAGVTGLPLCCSVSAASLNGFIHVDLA